MGALVAIVCWLGFFCLVAAIVIVRSILRHRERMAMIEKGIAPQPKTPQAHLKRGLTLSLLGTGILVCFVILRQGMPLGEGALLIGIILLPIGIAELVYYRLTRPKAAPPAEEEKSEPSGAGKE